MLRSQVYVVNIKPSITGVGEAAWWLQCLLGNREDKSLDPQHPCRWRMGVASHLYSQH